MQNVYQQYMNQSSLIDLDPNEDNEKLCYYSFAVK